jgi:predicted nucleic acid-binding protein
MSGDSVFFDSNVLVYLFDRHARAKQARAQALLAEHAADIAISTQVLQEFFVAATRKLRPPLSIDEAEAQVTHFCAFDLVVVNPALIRAAIGLVRDHAVPFWDALIVEAARSRGCRRVFSEDLQDGREFGRLRIVNPFARM